MFTNSNTMEQVGPTSQNQPTAYRLGHVAIRVQDMNRAKVFYQNLGLSIVWDAADWTYMKLANGNDGIALLSPDYKSAGPHFAFHFPNKQDIELTRSELMKNGYEVGPIHDHRDGTSSFYLQDSEGNWLEILYESIEGISSNISIG